MSIVPSPRKKICLQSINQKASQSGSNGDLFKPIHKNTTLKKIVLLQFFQISLY